MSNLIKLRSDEQGFISNLPNLFSSSLLFINELSQNARRAKATHLSITTEYVNNSLTIQFIDDGKGISDFSVLFNSNKSGWDKSTAKIEGSFGLGFLSAVLSSSNIVINSLSETLEVNTDALLSGGEFNVTKNSNFTQGTTVTLTLKKPVTDMFLVKNNTSAFGTPLNSSNECLCEVDACNSYIKEVLAGFSIPVILNGVEIERTLSLDESYTEGKLAWYKTSQLATVHPKRLKNAPNDFDLNRLFLQGLPVCKFHIHTHVKNDSLEVRLPDRTSFLEHDEALQALSDDASELSLELFKGQLKQFELNSTKSAYVIFYLKYRLLFRYYITHSFVDSFLSKALFLPEWLFSSVSDSPSFTSEYNDDFIDAFSYSDEVIEVRELKNASGLQLIELDKERISKSNASGLYDMYNYLNSNSKVGLFLSEEVGTSLQTVLDGFFIKATEVMTYQFDDIAVKEGVTINGCDSSTRRNFVIYKSLEIINPETNEPIKMSGLVVADEYVFLPENFYEVREILDAESLISFWSCGEKDLLSAESATNRLNKIIKELFIAGGIIDIKKEIKSIISNHLDVSLLNQDYKICFLDGQLTITDC